MKKVAKLTKELRAATTQVTAGKAFQNHARGMAEGFGKIMDHVRGARGLIHYRTVGDGSRDTFSNEPMLDDKQQNTAKGADKDLADIERALDSVWKKVRDFERTRGRDLDSFMKYM